VSQLFRYLLVGIVNTGFGYCIIFFMMYFFGINPIASNVTGYSFGLLSSYYLNRTITFKSRKKKLPEFTKFLLLFLVSYGLNLTTLLIIIKYTEINEGMAQLLSGAVFILCSYVLNRFVVYRQI
jgi:putative flippase GtrA